MIDARGLRFFELIAVALLAGRRGGRAPAPLPATAAATSTQATAAAKTKNNTLSV